MSPLVEVSHLSKRFGSFDAVNDLSFTVYQGDVFGFLGQNGAGKSTTIRMLLSLIRPSGGEIRIFGRMLQEAREEILRKTGAIIENPDLYPYLSGFDNLRLFARMGRGDSRRSTMMAKLEQVGLASRAGDAVRTYSQGMKQRLGIAVALVHDPKLIILDEPTNGLDPQGIADVRNLILHLSRHKGKTILVSSHLLSEIELIADRMLIIDKGRKIVEGAVKELFDPSRMLVEVELENMEEVRGRITASQWNQQCRELRPDGFVFQLNKQQVPQLTADLLAAGARVLAITPRHSLEDYFLSLTSANQHVDHFTN